MKKNKILAFAFFLNSFLGFSQVGINTNNPLSTFHIDGMKDNPATGVPTLLQQYNDVVVTENGNIGVGTINPSKKLDILSIDGNALRISDTTEGLGKVLMSDSDGNARWAMPGTTFAKLGSIPEEAITRATIDDPDIAGDQRIAYSGSSITLDPGKYQINFTMWCAPTGGNAANSSSNSGFASIFLSTSATENISPTYITPIKSIIIPRLYNNASSNSDYYGSGNIAVNITTTTTLYLWVYMANGNWTNSGTRSIIFRYDKGFYGPYVQMYAIPFEVE